MPQVVEAQRAQTRRAVAPAQRGWIEVVADRAAEHEVVGPGEPLASGQAGERGGRLIGQRHRAPLARLRRGQLSGRPARLDDEL